MFFVNVSFYFVELPEVALDIIRVALVTVRFCDVIQKTD